MTNSCKKCHYPHNHPFGLTFKKNICSGCITHEEKNTLNWDLKAQELQEIILKYKKNNSRYDCVVPVIGDAEDYYVLNKVLELGLSPLVVSVNDYFKNDLGWHNIHNLITYFDVDSIMLNPDKYTYLELVRTSLRKFDHVLLPFLQLHTSFPVHIAYERKIPLIIWGQNQSIEQVGKFSHNDNVEMSRWSRRQHDLFEVEIKTLIGNGAQVNTRNLNYYQYPNIKKLAMRGVKGIYLSNYLRWDPLSQNASAVGYGFKPEDNNSSFDIYERSGSSVYYHIHDLLKFKRCGYRKVNDHVAREIRHERISSKQGEDILRFYNKTKFNIKPFFDWLGVTDSGYKWFIKHRLNGFESLIHDKDEIRTTELPNKLQAMLKKSYKSEESFLTYKKGI